ncbi:MAG: DUF3592 domain-containing protein [Anaerolineae bacterium]|nr:DUF3592 domain-containing protein [Anaerolineae bacterium]
MIVEITLMILFAYGYYRWTIEWLLNGPTAEGTILGLREEKDDNGTRYYVTYQFAAPGPDHALQTFVHERRFTMPSAYETFRVGDTVEITYSPIDPSASAIAGIAGAKLEGQDLPGTFFPFEFVGFYFPVAIVLNLAVITGLVIYMRRAKS